MANFKDSNFRSEKDDINASSTMSEQAMKLVDDTLEAMASGVRDVKDVVNQGKSSESTNINSAEKLVTENAVKDNHAMEFADRERRNKSKEKLLDKGLKKKDKEKLEAKGREGASITGDNQGFDKETKKETKRAAEKIRADLERKLKKRNGDIKVYTPNAGKIVKSISEDGGDELKLELKVKDSNVSIIADAGKGSIEEKVKKDIEKKESPEQKLQRLRGLKKAGKELLSSDERVLHGDRSSKKQSIASARLAQKQAAAR